MCWCIHPLFANRIFLCFGMSSFVCIVLSNLNIFLVFLLSLLPSGLFPQVVLFVLLSELLFLFVPTRSSILLQSNFFFFFLLVLDFLSAFPVEFPIQVVGFCLWSFGEHRFYHRLIWLLHRFIHLNPWRLSLRYVLMIYLIFQFLPWQFLSLGFLAMII